jgi:putative transposase
VDLNVKAIVCSDGARFETPQPLRRATRRINIRQRRVSRKTEAAKLAAGFARKQRLPKGTRLQQSINGKKSARRLAATHQRVRNLRRDFQHKTTSEIVRKSHATVIEDLSVKGMTASARGTEDVPGKRVKQKSGLNRAILDVGFYEIRRQIEYKNARVGKPTIVAERWFPSSKTCSGCGHLHRGLKLHHRVWTCPSCGQVNDRDFNASMNLERLAGAPGTTVLVPEAFRESTPVRARSRMSDVKHEPKPVGNSGQEASLREERHCA